MLASRAPALLLAACTAAVLSEGGFARADATSNRLDDIVQVELLHGFRTTSGSHMAAMRMSLAKDWKTYWRVPGESGIPPRFDWRGSSNLREVRFHWPAPGVFNILDSVVIGYKDELVLPIELVPHDPEQEISVNSFMEFGVCKDICVATSARLDRVLYRMEETHRGLIEQTLGKRAVPAGSVGLRHAECSIDKADDGFVVTALVAGGPRLSGDVHGVFELPGADAWIRSRGTTVSESGVTTMGEIRPVGRHGFFLDRSRLKLTLLALGRAFELAGCPEPGFGEAGG